LAGGAASWLENELLTAAYTQGPGPAGDGTVTGVRQSCRPEGIALAGPVC